MVEVRLRAGVKRAYRQVVRLTQGSLTGSPWTLLGYSGYPPTGWLRIVSLLSRYDRTLRSHFGPTRTPNRT